MTKHKAINYIGTYKILIFSSHTYSLFNANLHKLQYDTSLPTTSNIIRTNNRTNILV